MQKIINKIKDKKTRAVLKSYLRAVLASAITMAIALTADLEPQYAVLLRVHWLNGQIKPKKNLD